MDTIILELRSGEGGEDSKLLVIDQLAIYDKLCTRLRLSMEVVEQRPGFICATISGKDVAKTFKHESGGHRFQRIPPTEKRGRIQSSTITVAVLPVPKEQELRIPDKDLRVTVCLSGGSGGQHVNRTESAVQLLHIPTGILVRCESERSQAQNRLTAMDLLRSKLAKAQNEKGQVERNQARRDQVGTGERSDKVRTIQEQNDTVLDHVTGKRTTVRKYRKGLLEDLWA